MEAEEDEALAVPNTDPPIQSHVNSQTTAIVLKLPQENTELQCETESAVELGDSQPPADSLVIGKEEWLESKELVEGEETLGVEPGKAVAGGDLIGGGENREVLDVGDAVEVLSTIGGENDSGVVVGGQEGDLVEKFNVAEDVAVGDVLEKTEAEVTEERVTVEETEVADVVEKDQMLEETKVAYVVEQTEILEETVVAADVADGGTMEEIEVSEKTEIPEIPEKTEVIDVADRSRNVGVLEVNKQTEIPEETEVDMKLDGGGFAEENEVADMVEQMQTALSEGKGDADITEQRDILGEKQAAYLAEKSEDPEQRGLVNIDGKKEILEEEELPDVSQQTGFLEETNVLREGKVALETDIAEEADDTEMGEETEKEDDREMANSVDEDEKAEETETDEVDVAETETADDTEMTDLMEGLETEVAEEMEEAKEVEEVSKTSGGPGAKRKRGKNSKAPGRAPSRKKVGEDVCFICFDGGDLVLCDRRGCPKAYHSSCVGRDEAFFQSKGQWNCGWHLCSNCKKNSYYMCYTCTFSLCKGCIKDAVFFSVRGNKGFCESCRNYVTLIERNQQGSKEMAQVDFDDKSSWEYLFKDYWIDLKRRLSITSDELAKAKNLCKGSELQDSKQELPHEPDSANNDRGSGSDGSNAEVTVSRRRKTRSQSKSHARERDSPSTITAVTDEGASVGENDEWASKELLDVVMHMRNGDKSVLSRIELNQLILDYIKKHELRDRRNKSYVICDLRLKDLFGKPRVGHIEMLNLLDRHIFFTKEDSHMDDLQGTVVDGESNQLDADWNSDAMIKASKDKKRKTRKKGNRGPQSNLDDYAAIDMHNINLIYLRRNLAEDLLEDTETFYEKVVGAFVRIRISGAGQKQDLYRLVQVVGTNKIAEPYRLGKKTTDFLLEILNLNKSEVISIDIISNQEFTEDECKRLRQSIKCGLIGRLTVGDIQEKAMILQPVRVKDWLESEIVRLSHLRDRASEKGRKKELRECVEKLQLLKTPEERQRRLEEIPEIHADPNMDPSYESEEDEDETDNRRNDSYMRPRGNSFSRRGREAVSPQKGGFGSSDSWSGTRNYPSTNRELSRNLSSKGISSKDDSVGAVEMGNENLWVLGQDRETKQPNSWDKPKTPLNLETGARNTHSIVMPEPSSKILPEVSPATPGATTAGQINETEKMWHYQDPSGKVQGPFSMVQLRKWNKNGYFPVDLKIWRKTEMQDDSILLTDALAGKFQKDTTLVTDIFSKAQMASYSGNLLHAPLQQGIEDQAGEGLKFDQNYAAWSPHRTAGSLGQSAGESWKSQPEVHSTGRAAPSSLEVPKHSQDAWGSETNLPSPTPNQPATAVTRGQALESKLSPKSIQPSGSLSVANLFRGDTGLQPHAVGFSESGSPAPKPETSMLLSSANAHQMHSQLMVSSESQRMLVNVQTSINSGADDVRNAGVSLQNLVQPVSSHTPLETHRWGSGSVSRPDMVGPISVPAAAVQAWGSASSQKLDPNTSLSMPAQPVAYGNWNNASSSGHNSSASVGTGNPVGSFPIPGQMGLPASDSWRPPVQGQPNVQPPTLPNLSWGIGAADNQNGAPRPVAGNQNPGWGPMPGNPNMGWGAPVPMNTNVSWGTGNQGSAPVNANPGWAAPVQGQMPTSVNSGWVAPGNAMPGWVPTGQAPPFGNAGSGWVAAPGQGAAPGNANPGWAAPQNPGNTAMWGNEQNPNGDRGSQGGDSGYGGAKPYNRQPSFGTGGGSSRPPFNKAQRVCQYHKHGHCKKGAQCDYLHT
ncbi:hypothetical protein SLE2022_043120 [Rubroshorea leprosula]